MKLKKKVCILSNDLKRGGTDTFVVNLINELNDNYDVTLVLSINSERTAIRENDAIKAGAKIIKTCDLKGMNGRIKHLVKLYQILKNGDFDVFQTNIDLFNGPNLLVAWLAGIRIRVCHSHNSRQGRELVLGKTLFVRVYQYIMKKLCWHFSNRRCGCSELAMDFLYDDKWKKDEKSFVINNGIDIDLFKHHYNTFKIKNELKLSAKYNILTVGRIDEQKNPLFIVEVFNALCRQRDDCDLIWVGKGKMEIEVRETLKRYNIQDRVHMLGLRHDVPEIMNCCDLFLFPSAFEGLGIVLIEAQAANLPCIVSDVVPREADCGGCKFLSLDENSNTWGREISKVLDGDTKLNVNENKLNKFSIQNMAYQMKVVFD